MRTSQHSDFNSPLRETERKCGENNYNAGKTERAVCILSGRVNTIVASKFLTMNSSEMAPK